MTNRDYSSWGKWDLHVHCPGTKKNDQYNGLSLEDFCEELIKLDLTVVGITDYFSVDHAFKVKRLLKEKNSEIVVFPNIELRDDKTPNNKPLNYHVIFNPEIEEEKIKSVLGRVSVNIDGLNGSRTYLDSDSEDVAERGYVNIEDIREQLCKDLCEHSDFIIGVAAGSDGYRARGNEGKISPLGQNVSENIIGCADFIFGSPRDRKYWLNPTGYDSRPRPVFRGSDAHSLGELKEYHQGDEVTWIKAKPTMEGLLQTLVEPDSRCRIQGNLPHERKSGTWIERVYISDKQESGIKKFSQDIYLSPGLNSIIGSRSSGKSILLSSISHASNPEETEKSQIRAQPWLPEKRKNEIGPAAGWSWEDADNEYEVRLHWNGCEYEDSGTASPTSEDLLGNVVYIPQGYLNLIAESPDYLMETLERSLSDELRKLISESSEYIRRTNRDISDFVEALHSKIIEQGKIEKQLADSRRISTINEDIRKNKLRIEEIQDSFSQQDRDEYQELIYRIDYGTSLTENRDGHLYRRRADEFIGKVRFQAKEIFSEFPFSVEILESIDSALIMFRETISEMMDRYSEAENRAIELNHRTLNEAQLLMRDKFDSFSGGAGIDGEITRLNNNDLNLREEKRNVDRLLQAKAQIQLDISNIVHDIVDKRSKIFSHIEQYKEFFANESKKSELGFEDLSFNLEFGFELADEDYLRPLKKRGQSSEEVKKLLDKNDNFEVQSDFTEELLLDVLNGGVGFTAGSDAFSFGKKYAQLDFSPRIKIEFDGDVIGGFSDTTMSSGKRALVGLKLLLENSENIWPILLDQPEDDLDSRTITDLIVPYLRRAREGRQVIMVTHDANLVVGTDSENVIVANQDSATFKNPKNIRFWYEAGSFEMDGNDHERRPKPNRYFGKSRSIREHICDILDGGEDAFRKRSTRYLLHFS
ncbi:TrlF family AAA-like ATPase [Corynebacterium durum]|uniref:TrlF family AAA-like ATPase n=1 Tax=Corynebacterium durum TaxID=61592 RepID=UPI0028E8662D|nr:hypothetical protein [Corynebacterium durum]